jgi:hypothetical protein
MGDDQGLNVGGARVHLVSIEKTGNHGGKREVRLMIIADKKMQIQRIKYAE